jgi:hypothetical protein
MFLAMALTIELAAPATFHELAESLQILASLRLHENRDRLLTNGGGPGTLVPSFAFGSFDYPSGYRLPRAHARIIRPKVSSAIKAILRSDP